MIFSLKTPTDTLAILTESQADFLAQFFVSEISLLTALIAVYIFKRMGAFEVLKKNYVPFTLFVLFATLDAMFTTKGIMDALKAGRPELPEGNPIILHILQTFGWPGIAIVQFIWIFSAAMLAIFIYKNSKSFGRVFSWFSKFLITFIFYFLGALHFLGMYSWVKPLLIIPRFNFNLIIKMMITTSNLTIIQWNITFYGLLLGLELVIIHYGIIFFLKSLAHYRAYYKKKYPRKKSKE